GAGASMNVRVTITLAAVLAVLAVAVWLAGRNEAPASTSTTSSTDLGPVLLNAGSEDMTEIGVQSGGQQIVARRGDDGNWTYATSASGPFAPADTQRIGSLTTRLDHLKAQSTIAEQPDAAAIKEYGLDSPTSTVTVRTKSGDATTFAVGSDNPRSTGKYVSAKGRAPAYHAQ